MRRIKEKAYKKAAKTLYSIDYSLSLEKCFLTIVLVPVALKSKKEKKRKKKERKRSSQFFVIPVSELEESNRIRVLTI